MLSSRTIRLLRHIPFAKTAQIHTTSFNANRDLDESPLARTWRILTDDLKNMGKGNKANEMEKSRALSGLMPRHADIVIIGGGAIGSSIAYWLKEKTSREGLRVIVVEKDTTVSNCIFSFIIGLNFFLNCCQ